MSSESRVMREQLIALSALPETLVFRNNTGLAWQGIKRDVFPGQQITVHQGTVVLDNARPIKFGLPGSGDIIGVTQGRAVCIESKPTRGGAQGDLQISFERQWRASGGIYILSRSSDDMLNQLSCMLIGID